MARRRRFGYVRRLPSGRFQASFIDPTGLRRTAPSTFERRPEAVDWLTVQESLVVRNEWTDPDRGRVPFGPYAERWIEERTGLRPTTVNLYRWHLARYLVPTFQRVYLSDIDPSMVRAWRKRLLDEGVSPSMVAKSYRLLRAVLNTAVEQDELIRRNPCRIQGAGEERPAERPVLSLAEVLGLVELVPGRFRALVLVTTFASLRFGEVTALTRADVDLDQGTVRVRRAFSEVTGRGLVVGPPKSRAGRRVVALPRAVAEALAEHLAEYAEDAPMALVFTGPKGAPIRRGNLNKLIGWKAAVEAVGRPELHFHDLRHTGNTLAAGVGVSTRDLTSRMGHDSMHAALIYQHATSEADEAIAAALDERLRRLRRTDRADTDHDEAAG